MNVRPDRLTDDDHREEAELKLEEENERLGAEIEALHERLGELEEDCRRVANRLTVAANGLDDATEQLQQLKQMADDGLRALWRRLDQIKRSDNDN